MTRDDKDFPQTDIAGGNPPRADLTGGYLTWTDIAGGNPPRADLTGGYLTWVDLTAHEGQL